MLQQQYMKVNVYRVLNVEVTMRAASSCYYIVPYH